MSRRSPSLPLALTAAVALLILLLMAGALPSPVVVADVQCAGEYAPPNIGYDDCKKTQAAELSSPVPTNTTGSGGGGGGSQPAASTSTPTLTRTPTATQAGGDATATLDPTATSAPTRLAGETAPTPTPSVLPSGVEALICLPGTVVPLLGQAPPGTPLLAYFDARPVGGGFSRADGNFSIDLLIGDERPGLYLVEVREREHDALVLQLGCEVPQSTPTPTADPAP